MGLQARKLFRSTSFRGDVLKLISGSIGAQALTIALTPILTRFFAPEAFGVAAALVSISSILGVASCLRFEVTVVLPESDEEAAVMLTISILAVLVYTLLVCVGLWYVGGHLLDYLNLREIESYFWVVPLLIALIGFNRALTLWSTRKKYFYRIAASQFGGSLTTGFLRVTTGGLGFVTPLHLVGSQIIGQLVSIAFLSTVTVRRSWPLITSALDLKKIRRGITRYRKFPLLDIWSSLMNGISIHVPVLLLSLFFNPLIVGYYALGYRLLNVPMGVIGRSVSQVFLQRASLLSKDKKLAVFVEDTVRNLFLVSFVPFLLLGLLGADIFQFVLGDEWREAGTYAQILSPWIFFVFLGSPISTLVSILERQGVFFYFNLVLLAVRIASITIGGWLGDPRTTLILFSSSGVFCYLIFIITLLKLSGCKFARIGKKLILLAGGGVISLTPIIAVKVFAVDSGGWLVVLGGILVLLYFLLLAITVFDLEIIKNVKHKLFHYYS